MSELRTCFNDWVADFAAIMVFEINDGFVRRSLSAINASHTLRNIATIFTSGCSVSSRHLAIEIQLRRKGPCLDAKKTWTGGYFAYCMVHKVKYMSGMVEQERLCHPKSQQTVWTSKQTCRPN